jgi:hypothetical protein
MARPGAGVGFKLKIGAETEVAICKWKFKVYLFDRCEDD